MESGAEMSHTLHLPQVFGNAPVTGQSPRMSPNALAFVVAWMERLGDRAAIMRVDERLVRAAQDHAEYLANRVDTQPSMHIGRNVSTPNMRVRAAGYALLGWHLDGNTVESCTRTWANLDEDMLEVVTSLMAHEAHREHMNGLNWYSGHTVYGVGAASEPSGSTYFVVDACPPPEIA